MTTKNLIVINKAHSLMRGQISLLDAKFGVGGWERFDIPEEGLTSEEIVHLATGWMNDGELGAIVFASPIALLLKLVSQNQEGHLFWNWTDGGTHPYLRYGVFVLHNDVRDKKELHNPDGTVRIVMVVAQEGWQLL